MGQDFCKARYIGRRGNTKKIKKNSTIKLALKEGKDTKEVKSYRPVALTIILRKIFERLTNKRLVWYLEEKEICRRKTIWH